MADYREAVRHGNLRGFEDPCLPLDLLADPQAPWFWLGAERFLLEFCWGPALASKIMRETMWPSRGPVRQRVDTLLRLARTRAAGTTRRERAVVAMLERWCRG